MVRTRSIACDGLGLAAPVLRARASRAKDRQASTGVRAAHGTAPKQSMGGELEHQACRQDTDTEGDNEESAESRDAYEAADRQLQRYFWWPGEWAMHSLVRLWQPKSTLNPSMKVEVPRAITTMLGGGTGKSTK